MTPSQDTPEAVAAVPPITDAAGPPAFDGDAALDALGHAIAVVASDWRIVFVNSAWERILGQTAAECARRELWACLPFLAATPASAMIRATRADGVTRRFDLEREETGGERYGVRASCTADGMLVVEVTRPFAPARQSGGHAMREAAFEEHEENAALRVLARQMAAVADSAALLAVLCEAAAAQCGAAGAAVIETHGGEGAVVAAVGTMALVQDRRFPLVGSVVHEAIQSQGIVSVNNFSASSRPLARLAPELRVGPLLAAPLVAHQEVLGVLVIVRGERAVDWSPRDTQRLRVIADHAALALRKADLLAQAQAADRAKGRFLATVSHELRTPLTALTGYEELLADEVLGPLTDSQSDVLERMRSVTHHLTVMIEEVLTFSSLEAGRAVVRPTEFLAADLVRAAAAVVDPLARQKRLRLAVDVPAEPLRVTSDIDKVRQILVNLAGNAVKFTDAGEVRLALTRHGDEAHFSVTDTGPGISPADLPRLFRPFSQLDAGLTRRHGGTGLGLYISERLARLLGGRISVRSQPGSGTTFTLALPV